MSGKSSKWSLQGHTAVCLGPSIEQETRARPDVISFSKYLSLMIRLTFDRTYPLH